MPAETAQEFRSYRVTLGAIALGVTVTATLWLGSSVAYALFVHPRPATGTTSGTGTPDVARCEQEVEGLLDDLQRLAGAAVAGAPAEAGRPSPRQELAEGWPRRWRDVGATCRFVELRDRGLGVAFDHTAWVHAELEGLHQGYATLLESYIVRQQPRVDELRRALEATRRALSDGTHAG